MYKKKSINKTILITTSLAIAIAGCATNSNTAHIDDSSNTDANITEQQNSKKPEQNYKPNEEVAKKPTTEQNDTTILDNAFLETDLSMTQRNSINMLNHISSLTQKVNYSSENQLLLEELYTSLVNDIYPNAVDIKTQSQITSLLDTIANYQMIREKRKRLEYIHEQNCAQAFRQAIPNPIGLLSAVSSKNALKASVSVLYMAIDSITNYQSAISQADSQYMQDGWELDDKQKAELHKSTTESLDYMYEMVRDYDFDGNLALSPKQIKDFVEWSNKNQLNRKKDWFESHENTYSNFGPYWLELVKYYYDLKEYQNCLKAINNYEALAIRIYRKDIDKARVLPMVILAAKEVEDKNKYIEIAEKYCTEICNNTEDQDWRLKYFAAQIYLDLYNLTQNKKYIDKAYKIAYNNIVILADNQKELNTTYLEDIKKVEILREYPRSKKKEIKRYNKLLKNERKKALPPVSEALYLNMNMLFPLADTLNISKNEKNKIHAMLHEDNEKLFLNETLEKKFWFKKTHKDFNTDKTQIFFNGHILKLPVSYLTDRATIKMSIANKNIIFDDWEITKVKRPKNAKNCSDFTAMIYSKKAKKYKYAVGDKITIKIIPVTDDPSENVIFKYTVKPSKKFFIFNGIKFERDKK